MFGGNIRPRHPSCPYNPPEYCQSLGPSNLAQAHFFCYPGQRPPLLGGWGYQPSQQYPGHLASPYCLPNQGNGSYFPPNGPMPLFSSSCRPNGNSYPWAGTQNQLLVNESPVLHFYTASEIAAAAAATAGGIENPSMTNMAASQLQCQNEPPVYVISSDEEDCLEGPINGVEDSTYTAPNINIGHDFNQFNPYSGTVQSFMNTTPLLPISNGNSGLASNQNFQPQSSTTPAESVNEIQTPRAFLETVTHIHQNHGLAGKKDVFYFERSSIGDNEEISVGDQVYGVADAVPSMPNNWTCRVLRKFESSLPELLPCSSQSARSQVKKTRNLNQRGHPNDGSEPTLAGIQNPQTSSSSTPSTDDMTQTSSKRSRSKPSSGPSVKRNRLGKNKSNFHLGTHKVDVSEGDQVLQGGGEASERARQTLPTQSQKSKVPELYYVL